MERTIFIFKIYFATKIIVFNIFLIFHAKVIFLAWKVFCGWRAKCFAIVYDNEVSMKKYDPKKRLTIIEREKLAPKDRKVEKKKECRKPR